MKKINSSKMKLNRDTIRLISTGKLVLAIGGYHPISDQEDTQCNTCAVSACMGC